VENARLYAKILLNGVIHVVNVNMKGGSLTIKNIFSMTPGECKVAEKLIGFDWIKKDCHVTFPVKDVGIDLFIVRRAEGERERVVGLQVKESRDYKSSKHELRPYHSWYTVRVSDFKKSFTRRPDFYVFIYYKEAPSGKRMMFKEIYVVILYSDLEQKVKTKKGRRAGYDFYFSYDEQSKKVEEWRDAPPIEDYTRYCDGWDFIKNALGIP